MRLRMIGLLPMRRRRRQPRRWSPRVGAAVAILLAGAVGWLLLGTGFFVVHDVMVSGTSRVAAADVRRAAHVRAGTPLVLLDESAVRSRISAIPAVASVRVTQRWPHGVRIVVAERVPILAVPRARDYQLVDATGVAFATVSRPPRRLPIVGLASVGPDDPATRATLDVLTALPARLRASLRRLEAASGNSVTLVLRDGRRVLWGGADASAVKAAVLVPLLKRHGKLYDVSAPDVVTISR